MFQTDDESPARIDRMKEFCEEWHHEPRCDSFEWTPPPAIDPGEGFEWVPLGEVLGNGDTLQDHSGNWIQTSAIGQKCIVDKQYRRRKPEETWPKYYLRTSGADSWVYRADGRYTIRNLTCDCVAGPAGWYWRHGNMVEVTEAEALARVTKPVEAEPSDDWANRRRRDLPTTQPKQIPVRLWVSYRIHSAGSDWPVRCTPANETFDNNGGSPWSEIKIGPNGFYVTEGER